MSRAEVIFSLSDNDGIETEHVLPGRWEVCARCRGEGKHVNPAVDGNGLSAEDFAEDPDFREDYMSGVYDVVCEFCEGRRVVAVLDEEQCSAEQLAAYATHERSEAEYRELYASERRLRQMESGDYS